MLSTANVKVPALTQDPAVLRLAQPRRSVLVFPELVPAFKQLMGPRTWRALMSQLADDSVLIPQAVERLGPTAQGPMLHALLDSLSTQGFDPFALLLEIRHREYPQPYFVLDDALVEMLEHTDLADDVPMQFLQLPFPRMYIELGPARACSARLFDAASGMHILEGAFCEQGEHPNFGRGMLLLLTGSPLGKADAGDDSFFSLFLPSEPAQRSLRDALTWAFEQSELQRRVKTPPEAFDAVMQCLVLWAKAVLYISLPEARRSLRPERSAALKELAGKKSGAKRAKLERRLASLVDHIVISAPAASPDTAPDASDGPTPDARRKRTHWRRGHYRMQAHGVRMSERKLIFLRPQLVNPGVLAERAHRRYDVR